MLAAAPLTTRPSSPPLLAYIVGFRSFSSAVVPTAAKLPKRRVGSSRPAREAAPPPHETTSDKINQSPPLTPPNSAADDLSGGREPTSPVEGPLTGSVVLQALQRAVAKKEEKIRKKKGGKNWKVPPTSGGDLAFGINYEDVRPIVIRSDWAQRIYELEKRVHEFQDHCN